jgi:hypothetical protein
MCHRTKLLSILAGAAGGAVAIAGMEAFSARTAFPLVLVVNDMSWDFLVAPVGIGAMLLALFVFAWHGLAARGANRDNTWPAR